MTRNASADGLGKDAPRITILDAAQLVGKEETFAG